MVAKPGDYVEVRAKDEVLKGILMPEEGSTLILKLDSGYNIGIDKANVREVKLINAHEKSGKTEVKIKKDSKKPTIAILHTGGTIASKVDYKTGGVTAHFSAEDMLSLFPELKTFANVSSRLIENMMSENMRFEHYNLMAKEVEKEIKNGAKGVIITHGTDTMHYTSAALSFTLDGLSAPVIIVGAQRSSDRGSSDAALNLLNAAYFIANSDFCGVAICMHENTNDDDCLVLPPTKTRKMHTSRRDAFRPINTTAVARVNYKEEKVSFINKDYNKISNKKLVLKLFNPKLKVGILKTHTHMYAEQFSAYKDFDGLVIEGTGLGQLPNSVVGEHTQESGKIINAVKELTKKMVVVMAPQTIYGRINMNVYSEGRINQEAGIIGNMLDMTPETAFIKLAWLLSNYKKEEAKKLFSQNLRGEISERAEKDTFLV